MGRRVYPVVHGSSFPVGDVGRRAIEHYSAVSQAAIERVLLFSSAMQWSSSNPHDYGHQDVLSFHHSVTRYTTQLPVYTPFPKHGKGFSGLHTIF